jgi:hypothetical protein
VLVVVEDGDVEALLQPALHLEAARCRDVLEVDAPETRREPDHRLHQLVDVRAVETDRDGVDATERLEQHRLALHDRQRGGRADVAETQDRRAVGDDRHHVRLPGQVMDQGRIGLDRRADPGHSGGVGEREVVAVRERDGGDDGHLAAAVQGECWVLGCHDGEPCTRTTRQAARLIQRAG